MKTEQVKSRVHAALVQARSIEWDAYKRYRGYAHAPLEARLDFENASANVVGALRFARTLLQDSVQAKAADAIAMLAVMYMAADADDPAEWWQDYEEVARAVFSQV